MSRNEPRLTPRIKRLIEQGVARGEIIETVAERHSIPMFLAYRAADRMDFWNQTEAFILPVSNLYRDSRREFQRMLDLEQKMVKAAADQARLCEPDHTLAWHLIRAEQAHVLLEWDTDVA